MAMWTSNSRANRGEGNGTALKAQKTEVLKRGPRLANAVPLFEPRQSCRSRATRNLAPQWGRRGEDVRKCRHVPLQRADSS